MGHLAELSKLRFLSSRVRVWPGKAVNQVSKEKEVENIVILLHGSGITAFGMEKWLRGFWSPPPNTALVFPSALMLPYDLQNGQLASVWHNRRSVDIEDEYEDLENIERVSSHLFTLVEQIKQLDCNRITVGGFSMGGHQALHSVYRHNLPVEKCFVLSSYLSKSSAVYSHLSKVTDQTALPPLLYCHGVQDSIVPITWAMTTRDRLESHSIRTEFVKFPELGHDLNGRVMARVVDWLDI